MAISCDPSGLANAARCFNDCSRGPVGQSIKSYLLCQYANASSAPVAPNVPSNIDIADASVVANTIVTWTNSDVPTTNEIWKSTDQGVTFNLYSTVAGTLHTFTDTAGMAGGTIWYYKVRACNGAACSVFTDMRGVSRNFNATTFSMPKLVIEYSTLDMSVTPGVGPVLLTLLRRAGILSLASNLGITSISLDSLKSVSSIAANGCSNCTAFTAPVLQTVPSLLFLYTTSIVNLSLPSLTSVGSFSVEDTLALASLSLPVLATVTGDFSLCTAASFTNLPVCSLPALTSIGGNFSALSCPNLTTVSIPLLQTVGGSIALDGSPVLNNLTLTALQSIAVSFTGTSCAALVNLNLPSLVNISGFFAFSSSSSLSNLSIPNFVPPDNGQTISFDSCMLVVGNSAAGTGVDGVLRRCALAGLTTADIELNSPGNAAPDATGLADKATLILNGCTVNTN